MNKMVPFFSNTADDTHCYQAALKMVLKYFIPNKDYSWKELDRLTAKIKYLWTWPTQALINLHQMGFEIVDIDDFSIEKFMRDGGDYLIRRYGKEVGDAQIKHSDIEQERRLYAHYQKLNIHQEKLPLLDDVKKLIDQGYLIICNVNSNLLNKKQGYTGHFVIVFDYTNTAIYLHDPGLPPSENRLVLYTDFLQAWEYPNPRSKNIQAFRYFKS